MNQSTKTAVITGAGTGIGRAVALTLLDNGYQVVITGRRMTILQEVIEAAGENMKNMLAVAADVSKTESVEQLFDQCIEKFGRVDLLFNNAGIGAASVDIDELEVSAWQSVIDINLTGSYLCARRAFKEMKQQSPMGGRIINNGSISAYAPRPNSTPYTVSKHAITGLTRCLALDGRKYDIACGQIDIGNAETALSVHEGPGAEQPNGAFVQETFMDVQHVADSVLHMAELPLHANVLFMNVMATKMPFVGRG